MPSTWPSGGSDQLDDRIGGRVEIRAPPVPGQLRIKGLAQPVQDDRAAGHTEQVTVHLQVLLRRAGAGRQRPAGHQDDPGARGLDQAGLLLVGRHDGRQRVRPSVRAAVRQLIGPGPAGHHRASLPGQRRRPADQLRRLLPGQARAALRGVHGLGDGESVRPQMLAKAHGRRPVDRPVAQHGHVRGRVGLPGHRRRMAGGPPGGRDPERAGTARQPDGGRHLTGRSGRRGRLVTGPAGGLPPGGPPPMTGARARRAGRPWRPRPDPTGRGSPRPRASGTAPTAP